MKFENKKEEIIKYLNKRMKQESDKIIWQFENVTSFISKYRKEIKSCINFKGFSYKSDNFITIDIHAGTLGTMLDILASWHINQNIEIDKYNMGIGIPLEQELKGKNIFIKAYIAALLTQRFRSGYPTDIWEALNKKFTNQEMKNLTILHNRIKKYLNKRSNKIDNPNFYSYDYFLKGDGDFIYEDTLCDMKSSNKNNIGIGWIRQLFIYWFLNKESQQHKKIKTYNIKNIEIYNPLYDYVYKVSIDDIYDNLDFLDSIFEQRVKLSQKAAIKFVTPFVIEINNIESMESSFKNKLLINKKYKKYINNQN